MVAHIDTLRIGEIQGISYSITREKAPIFVMGKVNAVSFSRGKRGIAGSMVFIIFDRDPVHQIAARSTYVAKSDENAVRRHVFGLPAVPVDQVDQNVIAFLATPQYADEIPPFDVSLTGANEYGQIASMSILGVEFLNEGSGISVDDIVNEAAFTYVAREKTPLLPVEYGATGIDIMDLGGSVNLSDIPALVETQTP
jgi:hypothetical protein